MTTENIQYEINEFFTLLDKRLAGDEFIMYHGPAHKFREMVENIAEELRKADEQLYGTSKWTKSKAQVERELEETENELQMLKNDVDRQIEELKEAIEEIDEAIDDCISNGDAPVDISLDKIKDCIKELEKTIW